MRVGGWTHAVLHRPHGQLLDHSSGLSDYPGPGLCVTINNQMLSQRELGTSPHRSRACACVQWLEQESCLQPGVVWRWQVGSRYFSVWKPDHLENGAIGSPPRRDPAWPLPPLPSAPGSPASPRLPLRGSLLHEPGSRQSQSGGMPLVQLEGSPVSPSV